MKGHSLPDEFGRCGGHVVLDFSTPSLVQYDEQRDAHQKNPERGEKVAVRDYGFQRLWKGHGFPWSGLWREALTVFAGMGVCQRVSHRGVSVH